MYPLLSNLRHRAELSLLLVVLPVAALLAACQVYDPQVLSRASGGSRDDASVIDPGPRDGGGGSDADPPLEDGGVTDSGDTVEVDSGHAQDDGGGAVDAAADASVEGPDGQVADAGGDAGTDGASDGCPGDPDKTSPGECGCGLPETCGDLLDSLVHRYSFAGTGSTIVDEVQGDDGTLSNASLSGAGALELAGGSSDSYATLPAAMLSGLSEATVEMWIEWDGGAQGQRVISFGTAVPPTVTSTAQDDCGVAPVFSGGSWYLACGENESWSTARAHCQGAGGRLVAVDGAAEQAFLQTLAGENSWLGANDRPTEGHWAWATSAGDSAGGRFWSGGASGSLEPGAYAKWRSGQPDNNAGVEHCAYLSNTDWAWNDNNCATAWGFICEWRGHQGPSTDDGLWFTPDAGGGSAEVQLLTGGSVTSLSGPAFPLDTVTHVALVLDPPGDSVSLYVDGVQVDSASTPQELSTLRDVDAWIGRSHGVSDPEWGGAIHELRVYDRALDAADVASSHAFGSDPSFLD